MTAWWHAPSLQPPLIDLPDRIPVQPHIIRIRTYRGITSFRFSSRDSGAPESFQAHILHNGSSSQSEPGKRLRARKQADNQDGNLLYYT